MSDTPERHLNGGKTNPDGKLGEPYDETIIHKTILVGDSGVGKTSLLVQFDQGKFQVGSFSATVGIGFTKLVDVAKVFLLDLDKIKVASFNDVPFNEVNWADDSQNDTEEQVDKIYKVMLLGDSGVGKTCLLVRFKDGAFLSGSFISTVGIDFRNKVVEVDGTKVKLQIWDTAGQERFRSVTHAYYRDANALLLLYDVTNKSSFDNIRAWLTEINEYAQEDVVIMLLGNKSDMASDRIIKPEDGEKLAKDHGVAFMETSAKTGMNVDLAFMAVARDLKMKKTRHPTDPKFNVAEYVDREKKNPGCCS